MPRWVSLSLALIHFVSLHLCNPDSGKEAKSLRSSSFWTPHISLTLRLICISVSIICARHWQDTEKVKFSWIAWSEPEFYPTVYFIQFSNNTLHFVFFVFFNQNVITLTLLWNYFFLVMYARHLVRLNSASATVLF